MWSTNAMWSSQQKTPVSQLQEFCIAKSLTPEYTEAANEGSDHEPTFVMKVTVGVYSGEGRANTKKAAKHKAAAVVLEQMGVPTSGGTDGAAVDVGLEGAAGRTQVHNPVGELQELSQKRHWPLPKYDVNHEGGDSHAPLFSCRVSLGNFTDMARANSKKAARKKAAENLLRQLKKGMEGGDGDEGLMVNLEESMRDLYLSVKNGPQVPPITSEAGRDVQQFYMDQRESGLAEHISGLMPAAEPENLLRDIARKHSFEATFVDLEALTEKGERQCLVQIAALPVAVCYGVGSDNRAARNNAAHAAMMYLQIMTKSPQKQSIALSGNSTYAPTSRNNGNNAKQAEIGGKV